MKGFDSWLENNPFDTSDEHIEAVTEALSNDFYEKNEKFVNSHKFYKIVDKVCCKEYFTNFDKTAKLIERLFHLYKLDNNIK